jgi:hypothetical protein
VTSVLLSPDETASRLRLSSKRILEQWRFHKQFALRFVRIGRKIFYREEDVQAFIESQTESGLAEQAIAVRRRRRRGQAGK